MLVQPCIPVMTGWWSASYSLVFWLWCDTGPEMQCVTVWIIIIIITGLLMLGFPTTDEKMLKVSTGWDFCLNNCNSYCAKKKGGVYKSMFYKSEGESYLYTQNNHKSVKLLAEKSCSSKPDAVRGLYGGPAQALKPDSTERATVTDQPRNPATKQASATRSRKRLWCVTHTTEFSTQNHFRWIPIR